MKKDPIKQISLRKVLQVVIIWLLLVNIFFMLKGTRNEVWQSNIGPLPFSLFWYETIYLLMFLLYLILQNKLKQVVKVFMWICFGMAAFSFIPYLMFIPIFFVELISNKGDVQDLGEFTYLLIPFLLSYLVFFEIKRENDELLPK